MKLPADKDDIAAAHALRDRSAEELAPVVPQLLEWLQDMNWPVARPICEVLRRCGASLVEPVRAVLQSSDDVWKQWVLSELLCGVDPKVRLQLTPELLRIVNAPTASEEQEEVVRAARDVLLLVNYNDTPSADRLAAVAARSLAAFTQLDDLERLSRGSLQERLFGKRKYWECFVGGLITEQELRNVLISDVHGLFLDEVPNWNDIDQEVRRTLEAEFDRALFGRPAEHVATEIPD